MKTIFFSSSGRSGSKSIAATLAAVPNIRSYHGPAHEVLEALNLMETYEEEPDWWPFSNFLSERIAKAHDEGCHYVESTWCATAVGYRLRKMFPGCQIFHLVRDPKDFIRSGLSRGWFNDDIAYRATVNACSRDLWPISFELKTRVEMIAGLWATQQDYITGGKPDGVVRFEDLVRDGVDLARFGIGEGVVPLLRENTTETHTAPPPAEWPAEWHEQVDRIVGDTARRFGYGV